MSVNDEQRPGRDHPIESSNVSKGSQSWWALVPVVIIIHLDPLRERARRGDRYGQGDSLIQCGYPIGAVATARFAREYDARAVDIRPGVQIIHRANSIQHLDSGGRAARIGIQRIRVIFAAKHTGLAGIAARALEAAEVIVGNGDEAAPHQIVIARLNVIGGLAAAIGMAADADSGGRFAFYILRYPDHCRHVHPRITFVRNLLDGVAIAIEDPAMVHLQTMSARISSIPISRRMRGFNCALYLRHSASVEKCGRAGIFSSTKLYIWQRRVVSGRIGLVNHSGGSCPRAAVASSNPSVTQERMICVRLLECPVPVFHHVVNASPPPFVHGVLQRADHHLAVKAELNRQSFDKNVLTEYRGLLQNVAVVANDAALAMTNFDVVDYRRGIRIDNKDLIFDGTRLDLRSIRNQLRFLIQTRFMADVIQNAGTRNRGQTRQLGVTLIVTDHNSRWQTLQLEIRDVITWCTPILSGQVNLSVPLY